MELFFDFLLLLPIWSGETQHLMVTQERDAVPVQLRFCYDLASMNKRRLALAFLVSPIPVPVLFSLLILFVGSWHGVRVPYNGQPTLQFQGALRELFPYAILGLGIAYLVEVVLGLPVWWVFSHYRIRSARAFALGGALIGWFFNALIQSRIEVLYSASYAFARLFNPFANPFLLFSVLAASGSAVLFRAIAFSGQR